jgi:hypothetical protein
MGPGGAIAQNEAMELGDRGASRVSFLAFAVLLPSLAIGVRIAIESGSALAGVGVAGLCVAAIGFVLLVVRRRAAVQVDQIEATGVVEIDAGIDFACLPGNWPVKARETLNAAGAANTPSLPTRLSVADGRLRFTKKQSWGSGRMPFIAEVALADVRSVDVEPSQLAPIGSTLVFNLKAHPPVRAHLQLGQEDADRLADLLRQRIPPDASAGWPAGSGLVVLASDPPLRTPPARAGLLMMVAFLPFVPAMLGAQDGGTAAIGTLLLVLYALWLQMRRPPSMHRRLALALMLASTTFVVDIVSTGELWRVAGTALCLGLGLWMLQLAEPRWD